VPFRLARRHAANHIADGKAGHALSFCFAEGGQRVRGFSRLRNDQGEFVAIDDGVAVTVFRTVIDFDRHPGKRLDQELADEPACHDVPHARMVTCRSRLKSPRRG
jgi:hypothetical protein